MVKIENGVFGRHRRNTHITSHGAMEEIVRLLFEFGLATARPLPNSGIERILTGRGKGAKSLKARLIQDRAHIARPKNNFRVNAERA